MEKTSIWKDRPARSLIALVCLVACFSVVYAESIDDLFEDPDQGIVEEDDGYEPPVLDMEALVGQASTAIGGSVNLKGGMGLFLNKWPYEFTSPPAGVLDVISYSVGYSLGTSASLDVRPNSYTRFYTSFLAALDPATLQLSGPSMGEMFIDYTYDEKISFRAGKFGISWGQGGMIIKPGDIVSRAGGGTSLRAFMPLYGHGLTLLAYARADLGGVSPRNLSYAALLDMTFGSFLSGISAHYRFSEKLQTVAYGRRSFGLLNVVSEIRADWDINSLYNNTPQGPIMYGLVSFSNEIGTDPIWRFGAEYSFNGDIDNWKGHCIGGGLAISNLPLKGWRPGISAKHALMDNSGELSVGFDGPFIKGFTAKIGASVPYGARGSYYRPASSKAMSIGMEIQMSISY